MLRPDPCSVGLQGRIHEVHQELAYGGQKAAQVHHGASPLVRKRSVCGWLPCCFRRQAFCLLFWDILSCFVAFVREHILCVALAETRHQLPAYAAHSPLRSRGQPVRQPRPPAGAFWRAVIAVHQSSRVRAAMLPPGTQGHAETFIGVSSRIHEAVFSHIHAAAVFLSPCPLLTVSCFVPASAVGLQPSLLQCGRGCQCACPPGRPLFCHRCEALRICTCRASFAVKHKGTFIRYGSCCVGGASERCHARCGRDDGCDDASTLQLPSVQAEWTMAARRTALHFGWRNSSSSPPSWCEPSAGLHHPALSVPSATAPFLHTVVVVFSWVS